MNYENWLTSAPPETGNGCFKTHNETKCEDKFCNGEKESCKKFLGYRLQFLNELLPKASNNHRKEHLLSSIHNTKEKINNLNFESSK